MSAGAPATTSSGDGTRSSERSRSAPPNSAEEAGRTPQWNALEEVRAYRTAAREIVRGAGHYWPKVMALVRLAERARRGAAIPSWAQQVVWLEAGAFIVTGEIPGPPSANPATAACRTLRRRGRRDCPACRRALPSESTLDRWDRESRDLLIEAFYAEDAA